ncbi:MAG TPA: phospholipase C, phosphocholine-specific [Trebonia sp.]|nr:phospholipase C, phosphocholine-specific [Trebonia sp.]
MGTDKNSAASGVSRRRLLQAGGALAGAAVVGAGATQILGASRARAATGTIADLRHVVILMQENRSFDHYFGTLQGVRGFADKQALTYQGGTSVFDQPDKSRTDHGYLLPFHMDSTKVDAQNAGDLDHSWSGDHSARNGGLWNDWVAAKTEQCMGYFTRADLPFNYALADAFTICDGYHQSILGPTSPNRMYFWAGTSDGWTSNPPDYTVEFTGITTYPEQLTAAGASWQVYTDHEVGDGSGANGWVGDYGDNPLWHYKQYQTSMNAGTAAARQLAVQGAVQPWQPNAGVPLGPNQVNSVLSQFTSACAAGTLPQVSWIVAPYEYSEHPSSSPSYGAHYVSTVLNAIMGNAALWESTALFITYDEHDGYFDHVLPPAPETSVTNEFISSQPIGMGPRVPMLICSPWTRGGYVDSNTYDHTSMNRFLQTWTGAPLVNVTGWRNSVSGDLTAAFDFANPDYSVPTLPDTVALITQSDAEKSFPAVAAPAEGAQVAPAQEAGSRPHRPTNHMPHADVAVNRSSFTVTATMSNTGSVGVSLFVFPDKYLTASATPFTVVFGTNRTYTWTATKKNKYGYAFSIYGPDGFVRSFAGDVVAAATTTGQIPVVTASPVTGSSPSLAVTLANSGTVAVAYTLTVNDYAGTTRTVTVGAAGSTPVSWPVDANGYYDVIITANTSDGFTRRYAGRIA